MGDLDVIHTRLPHDVLEDDRGRNDHIGPIRAKAVFLHPLLVRGRGHAFREIVEFISREDRVSFLSQDLPPQVAKRLNISARPDAAVHVAFTDFLPKTFLRGADIFLDELVEMLFRAFPVTEELQQPHGPHPVAFRRDDVPLRDNRDLRASPADVDKNGDAALEVHLLGHRQVDQTCLFLRPDHVDLDAGCLQHAIEEDILVEGLPHGAGRHRLDPLHPARVDNLLEILHGNAGAIQGLF